MKLAMIGFGQAGGKIVDKFIEYEQRVNGDFLREPLAINTANTDLMGLNHIPEENRVLIGQTSVKGHGVGADNELGADVAYNDLNEIQAAVDQISVHEIDAFLIVAGLGGGTGSGGAPVLARHLKEVYLEPVYGLGVLPSTDEGGIYSLNAARSFRTFINEVDNLLVFDNDAWRQSGESFHGGYDRINEEIANRFGTLFSAGEMRPGEQVAESVVDSSEVINTLSGGGVSSVGYATAELERPAGFLQRFRNGKTTEEDQGASTRRILSLVQKAARGRLTLPCGIEGGERALLLVSGPPASLSRKGIEKGRKWIEEETGSMEVRGGDYPQPHVNEVSVVLLLSGVRDVPRFTELQQLASETQATTAEIAQEHDRNIANLIFDEENEIDPLF